MNLTRKRIGVSSEAQGGVAPEVASVLKTRVVTAIQRDPNFVVDETKPETRLTFKITTFRAEQSQIKDTSTNPPTTCTVYVGRADVSYQAIETATGIAQDSENLGWTIQADKPARPLQQGVAAGLSKASEKVNLWKRATTSACGTYGKATLSEATDELYDQLVHQVTQRAAPVDEEVEVGLPGGRLKDLSAIALDKRWSVLLEKAEQTPKLEKPEDDASRLYLVALAHEALAYDTRREAFELERRRVSGVAAPGREAEEQEAKFFKVAKGHLEQAAQFYREAITGDGGEKEFKKPEARIEYAVKLYATIERQRAEYEAAKKRMQESEIKLAGSAKSPAQTASAKPAEQNSKARSADPVEASGPNSEVIKLCQEKLDEATITDFIQNSSAAFDLSSGGLVSIKRACGDSTGKYVAAMRSKTAAKPKAPPKAPAKVKPVVTQP